MEHTIYKYRGGEFVPVQKAWDEMSEPERQMAWSIHIAELAEEIRRNCKPITTKVRLPEEL